MVNIPINASHHRLCNDPAIPRIPPFLFRAAHLHEDGRLLHIRAVVRGLHRDLIAFPLPVEELQEDGVLEQRRGRAQHPRLAASLLLRPVADGMHGEGPGVRGGTVLGEEDERIRFYGSLKIVRFGQWVLEQVEGDGNAAAFIPADRAPLEHAVCRDKGERPQQLPMDSHACRVLPRGDEGEAHKGDFSGNYFKLSFSPSGMGDLRILFEMKNPALYRTLEPSGVLEPPMPEGLALPAIQRFRREIFPRMARGFSCFVSPGYWAHFGDFTNYSSPTPLEEKFGPTHAFGMKFNSGDYPLIKDNLGKALAALGDVNTGMRSTLSYVGLLHGDAGRLINRDEKRTLVDFLLVSS